MWSIPLLKVRCGKKTVMSISMKLKLYLSNLNYVNFFVDFRFSIKMSCTSLSLYICLLCTVAHCCKSVELTPPHTHTEHI